MPPAVVPIPGHQRGFTLTELFTAVAVAAILAAVALPNLQEFMQNNARSTRLNNLVTALNYARSDAVSQRRSTRVCASSDNASCSGNNQFHRGVVVMTGATLLRTFIASDSNAYTLLGTNADGTALSQVAFAPNGRATGAVGNARFTLCDARGTPEARAVVLSGSGHPGISTDSDMDGIHDVNGVNLTCP